MNEIDIKDNYITSLEIIGKEIEDLKRTKGVFNRFIRSVLDQLAALNETYVDSYYKAYRRHGDTDTSSGIEFALFVITEKAIYEIGSVASYNSVDDCCYRDPELTKHRIWAFDEKPDFTFLKGFCMSSSYHNLGRFVLGVSTLLTDARKVFYEVMKLCKGFVPQSLPENWIEIRDPNNNILYVNTKTHKSTYYPIF